MPVSKRVFIIVIRYLTLLGALSFLIFYVWRAQGKQNALFSSSKNLRTVYSNETPAAIQQFPEPEPASNDKDISPAPVLSPFATISPPTPDTNPDGETMRDSFQFGLFPPRPETLSGSKSMSQPVVDGAEAIRFWTLHSEKIFHSFGPQLSREKPADVRFSEPSIQVQIDEIEKETEPPPTTSTTTDTSPEPAPAPSPTEP